MDLLYSSQSRCWTLVVSTVELRHSHSSYSKRLFLVGHSIYYIVFTILCFIPFIYLNMFLLISVYEWVIFSIDFDGTEEDHMTSPASKTAE